MNQKLTYYALCWFFALSLSEVFAQATYAIDRGSLKIGGLVSFTNESFDGGDRVNTLVISSNMQVFVAPGLAVGGAINFILLAEDGYTENILGIGPIISYYFGREDSRVYPFISSSYLLNTELGESNSSSLHNLRFSGGAAFMLARNVALSSELFFQQNILTFDGDSRSGNGLGLLFGISIFVFGGRE